MRAFPEMINWDRIYTLNVVTALTGWGLGLIKKEKERVGYMHYFPFSASCCSKR